MINYGMYDTLKLAENEIFQQYGDKVSIIRKGKSLIKYGRNASVGTTRTTVQEFQGSEVNETYATSNSIDKLITDDASFTGDVIIEGHTISGSELTFVQQTITANGQTAVNLTTPLARATRITFPFTGGGLATGKKIYVYEDDDTTDGVPDTDSKTKALLNETYNQSQKCSTSVSKDDYWIVILAYGGVLKKTSATVDIEMQIRPIGSVFRTVFEKSVTSDGNPHFNIDYPPALIIPKNHGVRMVATASAGSTEVYAGIAGYLASVQ